MEREEFEEAIGKLVEFYAKHDSKDKINKLITQVQKRFSDNKMALAKNLQDTISVIEAHASLDTQLSSCQAVLA